MQLDLIVMQRSVKGNERILTIVDVWSGFAAAIPMKSGTAKETADALMRHWVALWGAPMEVQTDGGGEFVNGLMIELTKRLEVAKIVNAPYSPFSTGKVERLNKTLKNIIAKEGGDLRRWLNCVYSGGYS